MPSHSFLDNVLGRSNSLTPIKSVLGIRRQGNGKFSVTLFHEYADGKRAAGSNVAENFYGLDAAKTYATILSDHYKAPVVVLSSAKAA